MSSEKPKLLSERIDKGVKKAIAEAIEKHRKLGESIAISPKGKVIILSPEEIPPLDRVDE
jgi:hypothetical protein